MANQREIWVFSEKPALLAELIGGAKSLGGSPVMALVLGPRSAAREALAHGADQVTWLGELSGGRLVDDYVPTLAQLFSARTPDIVWIGSTKRGRAAAGRLAARLGTTVFTDILAIEEAGGLQVRHMVFGGGAMRTEKVLVQPLLATVGAGIFSSLPARVPDDLEIIEAEFIQPPWQAVLIERKPRPAASVNLSAARRVVCAGRGLSNQADLELVSQLARALGSEIACTRPLAEGLNWLPRERYIGISGANVRPDLYFGVGVSGQAQHIIGMSRSRVVVAVNKDSHAPIVTHADYAVIGDLYAILPVLLQSLQARQ